MRTLKLVPSLGLTVALVYALGRGWNLGSPIPPLGKFLDPFHGFWQNAENGKRSDQSLSIPGLIEKVTVHYDSVGIPHLYATNNHDLYLAQGYITALDRLWQMEFQTHAAAGRVSEIIGKAALDYDRRQRRLGMTMAAQRAVEQMLQSEISKEIVQAYTEGVNARIAGLSYENLPFEYKLLDYAPEQWSDIKSALLLKYMAQTLNMGDKDLEMSNTLKLFGKVTLDVLYPDQEPVGDPIVNKPGEWTFPKIELDTVAPALPKELIVQRPYDAPPTDIGSNNWAVSGRKTSTGSPILCSDPHLTLSLPSIWYAIHLNSPEVNVMGVSLPGSPSVIIGFNDSIAWGVTNAQRDLVDWFQIQFQDSSNNAYLSDGKMIPTKKVVEKFKIKGAADFVDTITYTHHGPVVYDKTFHPEAGASNYAFRWVAHDPSLEVITFHMLNRAKSHADYMEALNYYASPAQNFVFASVSGDIAMRIQGKYPVRRKEEGKFILDGTRTSTEWKAFIPNEQNVMDKNPARGFVSSANQYPVDFTYPYYVGATSYEAYRNRRINQVLDQSTGVTPGDMMKLQNDNFNLKAAESLPVFLSHLDTTRFNETEQSAYRLLKRWNFTNDKAEEGASYFEAWWDALMPMIWDEMDSAHVAMRYPTTFNTIYLITHQPEFGFFDRIATPEKETARDIIRQSFSAGVGAVEAWKTKNGGSAEWARFKDGFIGHLLRQEALSYHILHGGNHDIVNAHSRTHGPSWRMVVSLEKSGIQAWGVYPAGQSGNPGSPHYNNMIEPWTKGQYFSLHFLSAESLKSFRSHTLELNRP